MRSRCVWARACANTSGAATGHTCATRKPPRQLRVGMHSTLRAPATCVAQHGGYPYGLLPPLCFPAGLRDLVWCWIPPPQRSAWPCSQCRGGACLGLCKIVSSLSVPPLGFAGSNGSWCCILLHAGRRKRLIPWGGLRCGEVAGSSFGVVMVLCAVHCSIPPGDAPCRGIQALPCTRRGGPFLLLRKSLMAGVAHPLHYSCRREPRRLGYSRS